MREDKNKITLVNNPQPMAYGEIADKFFGKWVAIYQPNDDLTFDEGTVVAYGDSEHDLWDELWLILRNHKDGKGVVERFREEDWCEGYVIIRDVQ